VNAARKVMQRSRPAGVGLAFESIAVPKQLGEEALRLCRQANKGSGAPRAVDATFDWRDPLPFLGRAICELRLGLEQFPRLASESRLPHATEQARLADELVE
jgi:hypothetical protein